MHYFLQGKKYKSCQIFLPGAFLPFSELLAFLVESANLVNPGLWSQPPVSLGVVYIDKIFFWNLIEKRLRASIIDLM